MDQNSSDPKNFTLPMFGSYLLKLILRRFKNVIHFMCDIFLADFPLNLSLNAFNCIKLAMVRGKSEHFMPMCTDDLINLVPWLIQ